MNKRYQRVLFIFRRDLRLEDNTGLLAAFDQAHEVLPCFIFDPRQVEEHNNYRSLNALQFMIKSLHDLDKSLRKYGSELFLWYGKAHDIVETIIRNNICDAVMVNTDYTPFSRARDREIATVCAYYKSVFTAYHDSLLIDPTTVFTKQDKPFVVFTPFWRKARQEFVPVPRSFRHVSGQARYATQQVLDVYKTQLEKIRVTWSRLENFPWANYYNPALYRKGGRAEGLTILARAHEFKEYASLRNNLYYETTGLSAHNKFGTVSIREVYHAFFNALGETELLRELYWRDFFTYITYHYPFVFGRSFHEKYDNLVWNTSYDHFKRWCDGLTGFPVIDAGMRQLNTVGFMHNRARLLVASFLTKDLHIDWRWGERYFAQLLVDYDPSVNNGNWQWSASTGCDAQPYFRIFNPWLQQKKFDPDCLYIKRWVPELRDLTSRDIHRWYLSKTPVNNYPLPMVDHAQEARRALALYKKVT